jgi:hypothetical protein
MASDFNPDAYLAGGVSGFDPDEFLKEKPSLLESGLRGAAQGATFGFADEATGALEALFTDKSYAQARDEARKAYEAAQQANPKTYLAGDIGGSIATAFIPGLGALNAGKGAKLAEVAGKGALQGGLSGLGRAEGDVGEQLQDTAAGALLGGATGALASKAGDLLGKAADTTQDVADRFTIRSLGGTKGQIQKLGGNAADVAEAARTEGIVTPFASSKTIAERADNLLGTIDDEMSPIYRQTADSNMATGELLKRIDDQIAEYQYMPEMADVRRQLEKAKQDIIETGKVGYNPSELGGMRKKFGNDVKDFTTGGDVKRAKKDLYGITREAEMGQIEALDPELRTANEALFRRKQLAHMLDKMSDSGASRSAANNEIGLNSWQAGIAGGLMTGGLDGVSLGILGRELVKRYGDQVAGVTLDKVAKGMKHPKFAAVFERAAQKGPAAVIAIHEALQKNPEYQALGE